MSRRSLPYVFVLLPLCLLLAGACANPDATKREFVKKGDEFAAKKQFKEAILEYRNAVKADSKFGEARLKLGDAYLAVGDGERAYKELIRAADLMPENNEAQVKASRLLLLAGQFEDAKTRARRVLDRDPKNVDALLITANAAAGMKDLTSALDDVREAIEIEPARGDSYTNLGMVLLRQGKSDEARKAFEDAVQVAPTSLPAQLALANYYWSTGVTAEAERVLLAAHALEPANALTNQVLALFYLTTGKAPEAERFFKALVAAAPGTRSRLELADYYVMMNRVADARPLLEESAKTPDGFSIATTRLAALAYAAGQKPEAYRLIDTVLAKEANNPRALLTKARWQMAENRTAEAQTTATAAVAADPSSAAAHYVLGSLQSRLGLKDDAIQSFNEALKLNPRLAGAQVQLAQLHLRSGSPDASVQMAEAALKNQPSSPDARLALVRGLLAKGELARAGTELASLQEKYPNAPPVIALAGHLALARGDRRVARAAYEKAGSGSSEALAGLLVVDVTEGKVADARKRIDAALRTQPGRPDLLMIAARTYSAGQDFTAAEGALRKVIEAEPNNFTAYAMLGQVYLVQRRLPEALAEYDALAAKQPNSVSAQTMAAMIVHAQNNVDDARKRYEHIVEIDSKAAVAANNLAWMYADSGENLDYALQLAQGSAERLPNEPRVVDTIGWVYYKKQLATLAVPQFERCVELDPKNPIYHFHLGLAYEQTGDRAKARAAIERALTMNPAFPGADDARARLASLKSQS